MLTKGMRFTMLVILTALLWGTGSTTAAAAQRPYRVSDFQVEQLLRRIEQRSNTFQNSLNMALDRSIIDGSRREDNINQFVDEFAAATTRLRQRFDGRSSSAADAREVMIRAGYIDRFMQRHNLSAGVERNWIALRSDLSTLADYYYVSWNWDRPDYSPSPQPGLRNRLTGTYRLNVQNSDDVGAAIQRATRGLTPQQQERLRRNLTARLSAPESLAFERNGRTVTVASSRGPQVAFEADGRERVEETRRGRTVRVSAALRGDQLIVSQTGARGNNYRMTFDPVDFGRRLRVTRTMDVEAVGQPVTSVSVYDRVSETAQLDLPRENIPEIPADSVGGSYYVQDGVQMTAILNQSLGTASSRVGDRFTLRVASPGEFQGAIVEGFVTRVDRPGQLTGRADLSLGFDRIRLRNGASYDFEGAIVGVTTPNGEDVRVDIEGNVSEDTSQNERTLTRTGIGGALGALLGAITGGGKGAAIGAAIGAGAGAGSVFVQGRNDVTLVPGTRFAIRAAAPRNNARDFRR
jgi:hypothetical protein